MSTKHSLGDPFAEEEVVSDLQVAAAPLKLKSAPNGSPAMMNWFDSPAPTSPTIEEAPFHIQHTDVPSFQPVIVRETPVATMPPSFTPFSTANTSSGYDEFGLPVSEPPTTISPKVVSEPLPAKTRAAPSARVPVGGVPMGVESLLKAVKTKNAESVATLLKQGINPNAQNEENQTALHLAVLAQSPEIVKLLLASPVLDPNMLDIAYNTPLHIAACHCDAPVRCSPDLSELVPDNDASNSATLVPASMKGDSGQSDTPLETIVRMLCADERTDVNIRNTSLHVPLIYSCLSGNYKIAALLVRAGASVNAATHTDIYPLHAACENGYADIVRLLLLNGALVNVRDYQGFTPLHLAARGNYGAICGLLWRHRADLNAMTVTSPSNPIGKRPCDLSTDVEIKNFLSGMKTSSSHPLEINFVTHQVLGKSRIGMTMCPGRNKKDHRRNLQMDIGALLQVGTQVLVTLVQQHELDSMKIPDMMTRVRAAGIEVIHAPIKDKWIPSRVGILVELVDLIVSRIKHGKCITVHCNGGKGRTGLVVAASLVALGIEPGPATDMIRTVRPGMLYNPAQIVYLRLYQRTINGREQPTGALTSVPTELAVFEAENIIASNGDDSDDQDESTSPRSASGQQSPRGVASSSASPRSHPSSPPHSGTVSPPPAVLSPASPSRVNLSGLQRDVNEQERSEMPDLPPGEQSAAPSMTVGTLIDDGSAPESLI